MRKVLFTLKPKLPAYYKIERPFDRKGVFHGFFIACFDDGEKNVQWTAAYVEEVETGIVHKLDTEDFRFVTE